MSDEKKMVKLTGLWANVSNSGLEYLSGSMGSSRILIYKNTYKKEGDNQPDYQVYIAENNKKQESTSNFTKKVTPESNDAPF